MEERRRRKKKKEKKEERRRRKREKGPVRSKERKNIYIKSQKSILAGLHILVETGRNFGRGGTWGCLVPVCMPVRDFPSVPAGTKRNIQYWFKQINSHGYVMELD